MKKTIKVVFIFSVLTLGIFTMMLYQSCQPMRYCHLLKSVDMYLSDFSKTDTLAAMDSVRAEDLKVDIVLKSEMFSCKSQPSVPFVQSAMATKLAVYDIFYDTVKHIFITSDQDFDNLHPAGALLNDVFEIPASFEPAYDIAPSFSFNLNKAPDIEQYHRFHVSVEVSGTVPYDTIFPPVKLLH